MSIDLRDTQYGLTSERQWHINALLRDYSNGKLSLRRIAENDPAFKEGMHHNPPKVFGVWEDGVASDQPNWVFTVAEMSIDERLLARIMENDMKRMGASDRMAKMMAIGRANEASKLKGRAEQMEAKREEMIGVGKLAGKLNTVRHTINGQKVIIGDRVTPVEATKKTIYLGR